MGSGKIDAERVKAIFQEWDVNQTGRISKAGLESALRCLDPSFSESQLTQIFTDADKNGDGEIDYSEFVAWLFGSDGASGLKSKVATATGVVEDGSEDEEDEDDEAEDDSEEDEDSDDEDDSEEEGQKIKAQLKAQLTEANNEIMKLKRQLTEAKRLTEELKSRPQVAAHVLPEKTSAAPDLGSDALSGDGRALPAPDNVKAEEAPVQPDVDATLVAAAGSASATLAQPPGQDVQPASNEAAKGSVSLELQDEVQGEDKVVESEVAAEKQAKSPKKAKKKDKSSGRKQPKSTVREGVDCIQELEMSQQQQVRSALGIGNEVWTIDWGGHVAVRSRHDAAEVLGEIPTNRFVTCMLHLEPWLMWFGMETGHIALIDTRKKTALGNVTGGHSSLVSCLACDDAGLGEEDAAGVCPSRRAWSGSDDFTVRQWLIETWRSDCATPSGVRDSATVVEVDRWKVAIMKGLQMHGHKNKVRCMLKLGPNLWTGSDDGTIRIWNCADSMCKEVIEDAHKRGVLHLTVVRSYVWSGGEDGVIKEWSNRNPNGTARDCVRRLSPEGFQKGVYGMLPLGHEVWTCGHHPQIQIFDQQSLDRNGSLDAHKPYVSQLIGVDRIVSKTVWSTSFADRKLKVWSHAVRDDGPDTDELKAENRLHKDAEREHAKHMADTATKLNETRAIIDAMGLSDFDSEALAKLAPGLGAILKSLGSLTPEQMGEVLGALGRLAEGLGKMSPEDMKKALEATADLISSLSHLDGDAMVKALGHFCDIASSLSGLSQDGMAKALESLSGVVKALSKLPEDSLTSALEKLNQLASALSHLPPDVVVATLDSLARLVQKLADSDLLEMLNNPDALHAMFRAMRQCGIDPEAVANLLSALHDMGLQRLLQNPRLLQRLLQAFTNQGMEHLLDDPSKLESIFRIFNELDAKHLLEDSRLSGHNGDGPSDGSNTQAHDLCRGSSKYGGAASEAPASAAHVGNPAHSDGNADCNGSAADMDHASEHTGSAGGADSARTGSGESVGDATGNCGTRDGLQHGSAEPSLKSILAAGLQMHEIVDKYKDMLRELGLDDLLKDPSQFEKLLQTFKQLKDVLESNNMLDLLRDPRKLADFLSNFFAVKGVFEELGFGELLEDPYNAKGFLRNYKKLREAFEAAGLEYLLDSSAAMKDFLAKNAQKGQDLQDAQSKASAMGDLEKQLLDAEEALKKSQTENERLRSSLERYSSMGSASEVEMRLATLAEYEKLGSPKELLVLKAETLRLRNLKEGQGATNSRISELESQLVDNEQAKRDAEEREKFMFLKYKELDIFKLDVIARELKGILKKVEITEKECKQMKTDANKLKDFGDRRRVETETGRIEDHCKQTEAHIHDVIFKCLNETQRRHIGIASDNAHRADDRRDGRLQEAGSMLYSVEEEKEAAAHASLASIRAPVVLSQDVERPDYGSSVAAPHYRADAMKKRS